MWELIWTRAIGKGDKNLVLDIYQVHVSSLAVFAVLTLNQQILLWLTWLRNRDNKDIRMVSNPSISKGCTQSSLSLVTPLSSTWGNKQ